MKGLLWARWWQKINNLESWSKYTYQMYEPSCCQPRTNKYRAQIYQLDGITEKKHKKHIFEDVTGTQIIFVLL